MATHMPFVDPYTHSVFQQFQSASASDFVSHDHFNENQQADTHMAGDMLAGFTHIGRDSNDSPLSSVTHFSDPSTSSTCPPAGPVGNSLASSSSSLSGSPLFQNPSYEHHYPDLWLDASSAYPMAAMLPSGDGSFDLDASMVPGLDFTGLLAGEKFSGFVDESQPSWAVDSLDYPDSRRLDMLDPNLVDQISASTSLTATPFQPNMNHYSLPPSPAASLGSSHFFQQAAPHHHHHHHHPPQQQQQQEDGQSPLYQQHMWPPQSQPSHSPQPSVKSHVSQSSPRSSSIDCEEDAREKQKCPYADCGKTFKDLKAHILTHQTERPEKCPIVSCEFHKRGFARKYDRNRHLVTTHYKSTIVCGFCPGAGTPSEKTFNRTDVFKRHLVSVHAVEQNPPNSRKKSPVSSGRASPNQSNRPKGRCSTCGYYFATAQDLFEHLDDCVLRVVQQIEPSEANNERLLSSVADDQDVKKTMERHLLVDYGQTESSANLEAEDNDEFDEAEDCPNNESRTVRSGKGALKSFKDGGAANSSGARGVIDGRISKSTANTQPANRARGGLTYSQGGVPMHVSKSRKRRKAYPQSWGCSADKMKMKKRVLCVFDGQRRLWKDDMMLGNDFEVRMKLGDGEHYVTDLDVESLRRAEGFHMADADERGPWIPSNYPARANPDLRV